VLYSIGSNGDSSFEEDMMKRASCEIHTFDPFIDPATKDAMRRKSGITFHDWGAGVSSEEELQDGVSRNSSAARAAASTVQCWV